MLKTPLLFLAIVLLQLGLVLALFLQRRALKAHQNRIVAALPPGVRFWRVALARGAHLNRLWRLGPVQALGVLVDEGAQVRLRCRWHGANEDADVVLSKQAPQQPQWRGPFNLRAGQMAWACFPCPDGDVMVAIDTGLQTLGSREALADMLRSVYPGMLLPDSADHEFALEKHKGTLFTMVLMLGLFLFAVVDTFVVGRFELIDAQIAQFLRTPAVLAGYGLWLLLVGVLVFTSLRRATVPPREAYGLAILVAVVAALVTPPVLKRVDQLTAGPSVNYAYRVSASVGTLYPVDTQHGMPVLRFKRAPEYWAQFEPDTVVQIPMVHGKLGLWQLDHERFDPPVIAFYRGGQRQ